MLCFLPLDMPDIVCFQHASNSKALLKLDGRDVTKEKLVRFYFSFYEN